MTKLKCNQCGYKGLPRIEQKGPHNKAVCKKCGKYIKFLKVGEVQDVESFADIYWKKIWDYGYF